MWFCELFEKNDHHQIHVTDLNAETCQHPISCEIISSFHGILENSWS